LPQSHVNLPFMHKIRILQAGNGNWELVEELDISWIDEICCACYIDRSAPGSPYLVFKIPTDLALKIENYMLDNYYSLKGFFSLVPPKVVIPYERISRMSIKSLDNTYMGNYESNSNRDVIETFVKLYNQSLLIKNKYLFNVTTYLTDDEKHILAGKDFDAAYETKILFKNAGELQIISGKEKGIHRVIFRGDEHIVQNQELYNYLKALSNAEVETPKGKYMRVITTCGEALIYDDTLAEEFYEAIKNEKNHLKGGFNCPFGVSIQIKENGEVVEEFAITGPSYLNADKYIALTTEGINVNIPPSLGARLENELRKNNYSLSYSN